MFDSPTSFRCTTAVVTAIMSLICWATLSALEPATSPLVDGLQIDLADRVRADDFSVYLGTAECASMLDNQESVTVTYSTADSIDPTTEQFDGAYRFSVELDDATSLDCKIEGKCTTMSADQVSTTVGTVTATVAFSELTAKSSAADCSGFETEFFVRIYLNENGTPESTTSSPVDARIVVDTIAPPIVSSFSASATENNMEIDWGSDLDDSATQIKVYYSTIAFSGGTDLPGVEATAATLVVGESDTNGTFAFDNSLSPSTTLYVALAVGDEVNNFSGLTESLEIQVVETNDFWEHYRESGGSEEGGHCSVYHLGKASTAPIWAVFFFALAGLRRRTQTLRSKS
jgi:hypothetical protein